MNFKDKYTTTDKISKKEFELQSNNPKNEIIINPEVEKQILSNDAYAIGELLETLINTMRR